MSYPVTILAVSALFALSVAAQAPMKRATRFIADNAVYG